MIRLIVTAATITFASTLLTGAPAHAAPDHTGVTNIITAPTDLGALAQLAGDHARAAGYHRDTDGTLVVNLTDKARFAAVKAAGATPRLVTRSWRRLNDIITTYDTGLAGTAWSIDVTTNQVVIDADSTVTRDGLAMLTTTAAATNGAARLRQLTKPLRQYASGGDGVYGGGNRCSVGFNVRNANTYSFLTAGHCGQMADEWFADQRQLVKVGETVAASFPGDDYAIVRYTGSPTAISGAVGGQDITAAADPIMGQAVTRRGSTTGTRSGTVTGLNAIVHYSSGDTVTGMIRTDICAEAGDSGGPLYDGSIALGLTSGGSGDCQTGGTTFYQPVTEALNAFGVAVF